MREMAAAVLTKSILSPSFPLSLYFQHLVKRHFLHYATKRFIPSTIYLITDNLADTINTFCISISPVFLSKQMLRTFCYIIFLPAYSSQASHICKLHAAAACVSLCDSVSYVLLPWGRTCNRAFYPPHPSLCQSWLNTYSATPLMQWHTGATESRDNCSAEAISLIGKTKCHLGKADVMKGMADQTRYCNVVWFMY